MAIPLEDFRMSDCPMALQLAYGPELPAEKGMAWVSVTSLITSYGLEILARLASGEGELGSLLDDYRRVSLFPKISPEAIVFDIVDGQS
jgi:hypothetical protein